MNLIYVAFLSGLIATSFVYKSEARLHASSIVGGSAATVNQRTYAVSIQINYCHLCGGGILNNRYIITAAHCFINPETNKFENREYIVVAGVINTHDKHEQYRVMREISKIYIPREFNARVDKVADIAVFELKSDLGLNQFITNVVLPPNVRQHQTYQNQRGVVCGYGQNTVTMRHNAQTNEVVEVCSGGFERRFAEVKIISNWACRNFISDIRDSQLCGNIRQRSPANPEGLCMGDSGSPLVIDKTIIGLVSGSPKGCREDVEPAIYTRVTSFIPFINHVMTGVQTANIYIRLARYEDIACGRRCTKKVLVEQ